MERKFLIAVDVQKIFTQKNLFDEKKDYTLSNIQRLANSRFFDKVIVTRCVNQPNSPFNRILKWSMCTLPHEIELDFIPPPDHILINRDTYGINAEQLKQLLNATEEDKFYVVGFDTDACVYAVSINLFDNNMYTILVEDACYSSDGYSSHSIGINLLMRNIGDHNLMTTNEIIL